jgi:hypothetical protein
VAKVLYRTALALLKAFSRELGRPGSQLYASLQQQQAGLRIRIILSCWIRIRIQIVGPDPDPEG